MKRYLFLLPILLFLISCSNNNSSQESYDRYDNATLEMSTEEIRLTLKEREEMAPAQYLSVDGTYRKNLLGEMVIEGTVHNSASEASFKDVVLYIDGYSKTSTLVNTYQETVYEYLPAGSTKRFKIKLPLPRKIKSVGLNVGDATPY